MISVIVTLVIVGVCLYLVENYVKMSPPIGVALRVLVVLCLVLWLLEVFGVTGPVIPRLR